MSGSRNTSHLSVSGVSVSGARLAFFLFVSLSTLPAVGQTAITTYHYDNYRTGWNSAETTLTPANVSSSAFGLLQNIPLDDQVDAQPLLVSGVNITAGSQQGTHDVVYVVTNNDTVYAIDQHTGAVLLNPNFGKPVRYPLGCNNNGPNVGIQGTPVIDLGSNTMYVVIYTHDAKGPAYRIHALDLGSLTDKVTPQMITASHTLSDGTTFSFNATYQRQRPGLLLLNGVIYAGFGSFCDVGANLSRGWLLGWIAGSLTPLPANRLNDTQATSPNTFFLSSIWMSGFGLAADNFGNILFVTGNSDYSGITYDGVTNIQESVVKVAPGLTSVLDLFTPSNWATLDQTDADFGSGGVLVLPDQAGTIPHLAVAAGKPATMFLMNADNLGGYSTVTNNVLGSYGIGACWCGPSYFVDSDGVARVVSSGGKNVLLWKLQTSPSPSLLYESKSAPLYGAQNGGFFTSVSSNGTSGPIIWAVSHPLSKTQSRIYLYAFNPDAGGATMTQLFKGFAGSWPNVTGNSNLVPVVANGQVYVASNRQLQIFGLKAGSKTAAMNRKK